MLTASLARGAQRFERFADLVRGLGGWRRMLAAFLAGLGAALSLAPVYLTPLLAVGLTLLVFLLDGARRHARPKWSAFAAGWFFGFGYFLAGIYWMAFSFFVQADQFAWMAPFAVMGMPAFLALFTGLAAAICAALWCDGWARIFLFASVFAAVEYARGHILTGLPWNLFGQSLAGTATGAQSAAWYGAYGLSLVTILLAAFPAAFVGGGANAGKRKTALAGFAVMVAGGVVLFGAGALRLVEVATPPAPKAYLRIVQPNIPQREKIQQGYWMRNFERQFQPSIQERAAPADIPLFIVWPENGAPLLDEAPGALAALSRALPENSVLIAGAVRRERDEGGEYRYFNSIALVEQTPAGRAVTGYYDKHHLVPFGEYLPFYGLLDAVGLAQLTPYGDAGFTAGDGPRTFNLGGPTFSPMICYEAIFPGASFPADQRPDWMVTVTNDAWFGDTSGPRQHLDMARLRAVEAGLPMARSANTGVSALFDAKGRLLARVDLYEAGMIDAPLPPPLSPTLYQRVGDWLFWAMTAVFLGVGLRARV